MKLYSFPVSPNCQKVLAVARELSIPLDVVNVQILKGEGKTPEFLARNPNGKVPVLEDDGMVLWESNAIISYLAAKASVPSLLPIKPRERAEVDRWVFWSTAHLAPAVGKVAFEKIVKPLTNQGAPDAAAIAAGTSEFEALTKVLDAGLAGREYVAGKLSIADFALGPYFGIARACGLDLGQNARVRGWTERMAARESVKQTMADAQAAMQS
jgi:glutathione S-transferase